MTLRIRDAASREDYAAFGALIREYWDWVRARYADDTWLVDTAANVQALSAEFEALPVMYGAPNGALLLADDGGEIKGGVAYKRLEAGVAEMKRMFVPARYHGQGVGRALCEALIARARADGYATMRLDTGKRFSEAIKLYRAAGFQERAPYLDYPPKMAAMMVFMERPL